MLIPNICQLDELPFLKKPRYKWISDEEEGQRSKIRLLQNIRDLSFQQSSLMAKIFIFEKQTKKDTSQMNQDLNGSSKKYYQELIVTTQKEIIPLQNFYHLLKQSTCPEDFSNAVKKVKEFVSKCNTYFNDVIYSKCQIDYNRKQFLSFGIYLQKQSPNSLDFIRKKKLNSQDYLQQFKMHNKFYLKCSISNYNFQPFKDIAHQKIKRPSSFPIENQLLISQIFKLYLNIQRVGLLINYKDVRKYVKLFDKMFHQMDQGYLKLQVFKNYPLLRSKFYLPIKFVDPIKNQRLDGPIFSNSDPNCMFSHFLGYNANTVQILQGDNCQICESFFQGAMQNPILTNLRDNIFNPCKDDVFYCSEYNRFKLIVKTPLKQQEYQERFLQDLEQQKLQNVRKFKTQIKFLNYMHFRLNIKKMYNKKRNKFNDMLNSQKIKLSFQFWGRKLLIMDPVRGKNCFHYQFTDLRLFYLNKINQNTFKCPICNENVNDNDIIYLKQVQIIINYVKFKTSKFKQLTITGECFVNHEAHKFFVEFKKRNKENPKFIQKQILQIKNFYETFIDPYVSFNQYSLGIPNKYQQKLRQKYLFGLDKQHQEQDSDNQDQIYPDILDQQQSKDNEMSKITQNV